MGQGFSLYFKEGEKVSTKEEAQSGQRTSQTNGALSPYKRLIGNRLAGIRRERAIPPNSFPRSGHKASQGHAEPIMRAPQRRPSCSWGGVRGHPAVAPVIPRHPQPTPAFPKENCTSYIMSSLKRWSALWVLSKLLTTEWEQRQGVNFWRGEGSAFIVNEWRVRTLPARYQCTAAQRPLVPWGQGRVWWGPQLSAGEAVWDLHTYCAPSFLQTSAAHQHCPDRARAPGTGCP